MVLALLVVVEGPTTLKLLAGVGTQDQAWQLTGNSQTDPSTDDFVGTVDTQPLIIKTNGIEAIRTSPRVLTLTSPRQMVSRLAAMSASAPPTQRRSCTSRRETN